MAQPTAPDTIVLIHGLWMTPLAWEHWVARYKQRGFKVITPGYPGVGIALSPGKHFRASQQVNRIRLRLACPLIRQLSNELLAGESTCRT
jgi:alpha-beta hydrolase superfamily lysophospholipase